ncbi:MAG: hypothetical protein ABJC89_13895 [Acidobacteriota bacterium]
MGKTPRLLLIVLAALMVCLGLGFAWGASGRIGLQSAADDARRQLDTMEARGQLLEARVSLYGNNFGDASRHLEDAKVPLRRLKARYQQEGGRDAALRVDAALAQLDEAQRLAGKLDSTANAKAGETLETLRLATVKP